MPKFINAIAATTALCLIALAPGTIVGAVVYDSGAVSLPASALTQTGVLTQSGVPSDWSTQPVFPGIDSPSSTFFYDAFSIPTSPFAYLQISFLDLSQNANLFASAYLDFYLPSAASQGNGLGIYYLGDEGLTGNPFGNPAAFQVTLPNVASDHLVLVVTDTSGLAGGLGQQFNFLVEGFTDTNYDDTTALVPEPPSVALLVSACALMAGLSFRHCLFRVDR